MAQIIRVIYDVDTTDLQRTTELFKQIAKESGLTEKQVEEISKEIGQQTGLINRLVTAEKQLVAERNKSMNPAQIKQLNQQIVATQNEIKKLTGVTVQAGNQMSQTFRQVGLAIAAAFTLVKLKDFLGNALSLAAAMEQNRIAFTNFTGSAEKADALLAKIEKFAAKTPFEFPELVESTKQLLAFGIEQENVMQTLDTLGNIAAGTGSDLKDLAFVYGTIRTQQTAYTQDLNQFAQRGIPIYDALAKHFNIAASEVKEFAASGKIGFKDIEAAFKGMTAPGEKFFGLMEKQSETLAGQFSTLKDNVNAFARGIGESLAPAAKMFVGFLNSILGGTQKESEALADQQAELNSLVVAITSANEKSEVRKQLLDELQAVYPDFLKNLDAETVTNEQLRDRLVEVNEEYRKRILLTAQQEVLAEKTKELTENIKLQKLALKDASEAIMRLNRELGLAIDQTKPVANQIEQLRDAFGSFTPEQAKRVRDYSISFDFFAGKLNRVLGLQGDYDKTLGEVNKETEAFAALSKELGISLEDYNKKQATGGAKAVELTKAQQKEIDDLAKALKKLREEAELAAVGGANTEAGIAILRARAIAELEAEKAFTQLSEDEQGALRLSINQEWDEKLIALRKKTAEDSAKITADLNKEMEAFRKEAFDREVADSKRLSDIKILQAKKDALEGLITEEEMNDRILNAEIENLAARREILKQFGEDTLEIDEEIVDKQIQLEKSITENAAKESEKRKQITENEHDEKLRKFNGFVESVRIGLAIISELAQISANIDLQDAKARYDREIKLAGDNVEKKSEIEERYAREKEAIQQRLAEQQRRQAIFEIILNTASAAVEALPNVFLVALVTALGLAQLAKARTAQYAEGVIDLKGPGSETSDSIPAMLSRGESVMTARETRMFGPTLRAMRANMLDPQMMNAFATGRLKLPQGSTSPAISFSDTGIVRGLSAQTSVSKKMLRKMDEQNRLIAKMNKEQRKLSAKDSYFSRKYKF